ncbi:hypothetical protein [Sediminibacter sp. Hel_I_10]|uniref:hypothetical protein n=1 Tax=Sediminibacter sp. Hel_I_10 TaxID=1392490 RepID=UPI00068F8697|nr:hypothetical protein [Sediminibacter sp. Hel_I_10]
MMKALKHMLVVVSMLTLVTGYSNEIKNESTKDITTVRFVNAKKGHQILIKNEEGSVIHKETVERNGSYSQKFDLTNLSDGFYTIELNKDFEIIVKPFKIASKEVIFLNAEQTTVFKPVVRAEKTKVMISQLALNDKPLKIELYYNDELIHKDTLKDGIILKRVYALSNKRKGTYSIRMTSGDRVFVERFTI